MEESKVEKRSKRHLARLSARQERLERQQHRQIESDAQPNEAVPNQRQTDRQSARLKRQARAFYRYQIRERLRKNGQVPADSDEVETKANRAVKLLDPANEKKRSEVKFSGGEATANKDGGLINIGCAEGSTVKLAMVQKGNRGENIRSENAGAFDVAHGDGALVGAFAMSGIGRSDDFEARFHHGDMELAPPVVLDGHLPDRGSQNILTVEAKLEKDPREESRKKFIILGGFILLIIATGSIVGAMLTSQYQSPSLSELLDPTIAPTSEEDKREKIRSFLWEVSMDKNIETGLDTPYVTAVEWIVERDAAQLSIDSVNLVQRFALVLFYYQTTENGNQNWSRCNPPLENEGVTCNSAGDVKWLLPSPECHWNGVGCIDDRVILFDIAENNLVGRLPSALRLFSDLRHLSLYSERLSGTIPEWLYDLSGLTALQLSNMPSMIGSISTRLGLLTKLERLSLDFNNLSGTLPSEIAQLTSLYDLLLGENMRVEGSIPEEFYNLDKLIRADLYGASLTGTVSSRIGQLRVLSELRLQDNLLSGRLPTEIGMCSRLRVLQIVQNDLTGSLPSEIGELVTLETFLAGRLDGGNPRLSGTLPNLHDLATLTILGIYFTNIEGTISTSIGLLSNLLHISLLNNRIGGKIPTEIGMLSNKLNFVQLYGNKLTGNIPSEIGACSKLLTLNLGLNNLTGPIPRSLGKLESLRSMFLLNNIGMNGTIPDEIFVLNHLAELRFERMSLTGSIPKLIGRLSNLEALSLEQNDLRGSIPHEISELTSLKWLTLHRNQINGTIPDELYDLRQLTNFGLAYMALTGSISTQIGLLKNVEFFSVVDNPLVGSVPTEVGLLKRLKSFYLSQTMMTGRVPDEVCGLAVSGSLSILAANDCSMAAKPMIECDCCTHCCDLKNDICSFI